MRDWYAIFSTIVDRHILLAHREVPDNSVQLRHLLLGRDLAEAAGFVALLKKCCFCCFFY